MCLGLIELKIISVGSLKVGISFLVEMILDWVYMCLAFGLHKS